MHEQSDAIRDESIQLLKEQASRLKMQNKQLELRDEQVRFLKETILALQQQKDSAQHLSHSLKGKLKTMASQIAQYNTNVVQKIFAENQELIEEVRQSKQMLENVMVQKEQALKQLRMIESRFQIQQNEKEQLSSALQSLKQVKTRNQKKIAILDKENKELQTKNIALERKLEESGSQINYCSQQIDVLTQKHHDSLKHSEKKLKSAIEKMVPLEEFERVNKEIKDGMVRNKQLRQDLDKLVKENEKLKYEAAATKDKLMSCEIKEETRSYLMKGDFANLSQSIKLGKKIAEFQSEEHQKASDIYNGYKQAIQQIQILQRALLNQKNMLKSKQLEVSMILEQLKLVEMELSTLRERNSQDQQSLEAQYENKIMEISLRLKKEEIALSSLKYKENQFQVLRQEYQRSTDDHKMQREAFLRTIEQLKRQNLKLSGQHTSALQLCQENLINRQAIAHYKYTLQQLVGVVHYLHLLLVRNREKSLKVYMPFITYFFTVHPTINQTNKKPRWEKLRKFRVAVHILIALGRMKKEGHGKGVARYASCAIQRRQNIENLSNHIEQLSKIVLGGGKVTDLLVISSETYRWKVHNFLKVRLPIRDDRKLLGESFQLQLDD